MIVLRSYLAALAALALTAAYAALALRDRELASTLALLYVVPLLTFVALGRPPR